MLFRVALARAFWRGSRVVCPSAGPRTRIRLCRQFFLYENRLEYFKTADSPSILGTLDLWPDMKVTREISTLERTATKGGGAGRPKRKRARREPRAVAVHRTRSKISYCDEGGGRWPPGKKRRRVADRAWRSFVEFDFAHPRGPRRGLLLLVLLLLRAPRGVRRRALAGASRRGVGWGWALVLVAAQVERPRLLTLQTTHAPVWDCAFTISNSRTAVILEADDVESARLWVEAVTLALKVLRRRDTRRHRDTRRRRRHRALPPPPPRAFFFLFVRTHL